MNVVFSHGQLCRRKFNSIKTHAVVGHPCNVIVVATTTISIIVYIYALMLLVSTYSNSAIVVPSVLINTSWGTRGVLRSTIFRRDICSVFDLVMATYSLPCL